MHFVQASGTGCHSAIPTSNLCTHSVSYFAPVPSTHHLSPSSIESLWETLLSAEPPLFLVFQAWNVNATRQNIFDRLKEGPLFTSSIVWQSCPVPRGATRCAAGWLPWTLVTLLVFGSPCLLVLKPAAWALHMPTMPPAANVNHQKNTSLAHVPPYGFVGGSGPGVIVCQPPGPWI